MIRNRIRAFSIVLIAAAFFPASTVLAGPPLICHPFDIGGAKSLSWSGGKSWRAVSPDYNVKHLADDTLALLKADMPVIARMETLRRASIYAMNDKRVALDLHSRLAERAAKSGALAQFDLGYLEETYKQLTGVSSNMNFAKTLDGYSSVVRAIGLRGGDAEMEFAAALITAHPRRSAHDRHLRKAAAGAGEGSLLARNLVSHFENRGRSLSEIRAHLGIAKN